MDTASQARLAGMYRTLKELADNTSPDLTLRQVLTLLYVGSKGEVTQQEAGYRMEMHKSALSKITARLAGNVGAVRREEGMGLIQVNLDPSDFRGRLLSLSPEGEKAMKRVLKINELVR